MKFIWIIQDSGGRHFNWTELYKSVIECNSYAVYVPIEQIGFFQLPDGYIPIVIGGDDYLFLASKNPNLYRGIFNNELFFSVGNYIKIWKNNYLNYDTKVISSDILNKENPPYFIRPFGDDKTIDGHVVRTREEIQDIQLQFGKEKCLFCISSVKNISKEWRAVIVNNHIINICRYAVELQSSVSTEDLPLEMITFAEMCCRNISDAPLAWILDVAECYQKYYVLECNIFNASNYYDCDRKVIVSTVEKALRGCMQSEINGLS